MKTATILLLIGFMLIIFSKKNSFAKIIGLIFLVAGVFYNDVSDGTIKTIKKKVSNFIIK